MINAQQIGQKSQTDDISSQVQLPVTRYGIFPSEDDLHFFHFAQTAVCLHYNYRKRNTQGQSHKLT